MRFQKDRIRVDGALNDAVSEMCRLEFRFQNLPFFKICRYLVDAV